MARPAQVETLKVSSSPLLNLSAKLQDLIFAKYYEGSLVIISRETERLFKFKNMPSLAIEQTCKSLRERSKAARDKHVSKTLLAEGPFLVRDFPELFDTSSKIDWLRQHINSLQFINLNVNERLFTQDWSQWMGVFRNLRTIEIRTTVKRTCPSTMTQPYMPLDTDDAKRRLIADVLRNEWEPYPATRSISELSYGIKKAWDDAMSYWTTEDRRHFREVPDELFSAWVVLSINAADEQGVSFYDAVCLNP